MKYDEFVLYAIEHFRDGLPASFCCSIKLEKIAKNNGVLVDALAVDTGQNTAAPMIYLQDYYKMLNEGVSIEKILNMMNQSFHDNYVDIPQMECDLNNFDQIKKYIYYRVIHYEMNQILLQDIPYKRVLDLAFTYRLIVHEGEIGVASYTIKNEDLAKWNISIEELHEIAAENTKKIFLPKIQPIETFIAEEADDKGPYVGLYVITNDQHINGATCAFYEGALQSFANDKMSNLYLLPASIHEMLLLPTDTAVSASYLYQMVREGNGSIVDKEDILSDCVYHYNRKDGEITIVPN